MAKSWTHDRFVDFVRTETEGFEVKGQYKNNDTKVLMYHKECNREFFIRPADFKRRKRCSPCNIRKKKTTNEYKAQVKELSNDEYEVLEEYVNDATKILTKHKKCSYEWELQPSHFIQGKRCPKCAGNLKKTTTQFIYEVDALTNNQYLVLNDYKQAHKKVKFCHVSNYCNNYEFEMTPTGFLGGKRCPECKRLNQSGEKHWKYNPELTEKDRQRRDMFNGKLRKWRDDVYKRDKYICQVCFKHSHKLNAHHLNSWNSHAAERFTLDNGITLCEKCHKNFHSLYGFGNNTLKQFQLYEASL